MEYRELENVIHRGTRDPRIGVRMTEFISNGKWVPSTPRQMTDSQTFGTPMTESQAKEFQGEGWPSEEAAEA